MFSISYYIKNISIVLLAIIGMAATTSCKEKDDDPYASWEAKAQNTLLVYISGDNSLSKYAQANIDLCVEGLKATEDPINIVIMRDDNSTTPKPQLIYLKKKQNEVVQELIKEYDEQNVLDTTFMANVINEVFTRFDTPCKGIQLWSHALSWIPSSNFTGTKGCSADDVDTPALKPAYFGQDENKYMELWDLRKALSKGPHIDYIISDACHMATAEVAYELRHATDYILASPTEVMGDGFPYDELVPILSDMSNANIEEMLTNAGKAYMNLYNGSKPNENEGAISLIRTAGMDQLAAQYKEIRTVYKDTFALFQSSPYVWDEKLQHYGRSNIGARYYFYDLQSITDLCAQNLLTQALSETVLFEGHTAKFLANWGGFNLTDCCGLAVSVPEFFRITGNASKLQAAYPLTQWGAYMTQE